MGLQGDPPPSLGISDGVADQVGQHPWKAKRIDGRFGQARFKIDFQVDPFFLGLAFQRPQTFPDHRLQGQDLFVSRFTHALQTGGIDQFVNQAGQAAAILPAR